MAEQEGYIEQSFSDPNTKNIGVEKKKKILKDQVLLLGKI